MFDISCVCVGGGQPTVICILIAVCDGDSLRKGRAHIWTLTAPGAGRIWPERLSRPRRLALSRGRHYPLSHAGFWRTKTKKQIRALQTHSPSSGGRGTLNVIFKTKLKQDFKIVACLFIYARVDEDF